jgi:type 1 glutamine amidotransferase
MAWAAASVAGLTIALAGAGAALAQTGNPGGPINDNLGLMDYGVCRGLDVKCFHNWPRPKTAQYRVLLFTRTAGPRHQNLGSPLGPGLNPELADNNVVQKGMLKLAEQNGWKLDYTEDLQFMTRLDGYNAVIFFSTSRDVLDDDSKTALRQYMRAGGGFVAIHNAFGTLYNWPYYEGLLGGANYYDHGPFRTGDVVVVDRKDASTKVLPARFGFKDEWYNLVPFPTKVRFLATVDETSWKDTVREGPPPAGALPRRPPGLQLPRVVGAHPGHGAFHPVAWCQYYDGGKSWVTTLGHDAGLFSEGAPGAAEFRQMIAGGVSSVIGAQPFCQ